MEEQVQYLDYEGLLRYHELIDAKKADKSQITDVVRYSTQSLTTELKAQARANIGAGTITSINHTITVKSGKKADGTTDISATSSSAASPSVTLGASGVTAGSYGDTADLTPAYNNTFKVPSISVNAQGIVTAVGEHTVKIPASDNTNTTYTFTNGTNGFTVTPAGGSAQTVTVTPSISKNVTGADAWTAADVITVTNANSGNVIKASGKTISTTAPSSSSTDTTIPTSAAVWSAISNSIAANDAMVYSGTIDGGSTGAYGALTPAADKGNVYKVKTAGKINGIAVEVGDLLLCNTDGTTAATSSDYSTIATKWDYIQTNLDGAVVGPTSSTDAHVATFNGTTGKVIKDSGFTIGKSVPSNAVFTDASVTAVGNHYTPSADSNSELTATIDGTAGAYAKDTLYTVLTGVKALRDAKGHVTGITYTAQLIKDTNNTYTVNNKKLSVASNTGTALQAFTSNEDTDRTLTISGDGTYITGAVSGSTGAPTITISHADPTADANSELTAALSGTAGSFATDTEYTVLTGVKAQRDAKGHVTGLTYTAQKIKDTTIANTDTKVTQAAATTTNGAYPIILGYNTGTTSVTGTVNKASAFTYNPSTQSLAVNKINGVAVNSSSKFTDTTYKFTIGSTTLGDTTNGTSLGSIGVISYGTVGSTTLDSTKQIDSLFITN